MVAVESCLVTVRRRRVGWQPRREVDLVERTC
jgi:hypothetical protein